MWIRQIWWEVKKIKENLSQNIENLENDILHIENKIVEFAQNYQKERVKKSIGELKSDLKYLAVLSNGEDLNKNEHREIMDFLRIHYNYLQEKMTYSKNLS